MNPADIEVAGLTKLYGQFPALNNFSLSVPAGNIVGLMGENGSGKTTLLRILAGVMQDYSGTVTIGGVQPGLATKSWVAYLPDTSMIPARLTAEQAIKMYADFFEDFDPQMARAKLAHFGVPLDRSGSSMSLGQNEKLQIALVMSRKADLYLLDEPLSGVDPASRDQILAGILRDLREDASMIISTHLIADIEQIVSYAVFTHRGQVMLAGEADGLRTQYGKSLDTLFREMYQWSVN